VVADSRTVSRGHSGFKCEILGTRQTRKKAKRDFSLLFFAGRKLVSPLRGLASRSNRLPGLRPGLRYAISPGFRTECSHNRDERWLVAVPSRAVRPRVPDSLTAEARPKRPQRLLPRAAWSGTSAQNQNGRKTRATAGRNPKDESVAAPFGIFVQLFILPAFWILRVIRRRNWPRPESLSSAPGQCFRAGNTCPKRPDSAARTQCQLRRRPFLPAD
jgi:hypothetical protein